MSTKAFLCLFTCAIVLLVSCPSPAAALNAGVIPPAVNPGDAFMVKVTAAGRTDVSVSFRKKSLPVAPCGDGCYMAVGACGMELRPGRYNIRIRQGKRSRLLQLEVRRASFPKMRISLPKELVSPAGEDLLRIRREADALRSATAEVTEQGWGAGFMMPLDTPVSTAYGTRRIFNRTKKSIHYGIDLRGAEGDPVRSANDGTVIITDSLFFGGNTLVIDHGMGVYSIYMHLSGFAAAAGASVRKGDVVGYVGSTGRSSGPHLHFGVKVQGVSVNPASLLKLEL